MTTPALRRKAFQLQSAYTGCNPLEAALLHKWSAVVSEQAPFLQQRLDDLLATVKTDAMQASFDLPKDKNELS